MRRHRLLIAGMAGCCLFGAWLSGELLIQHAGDVWNAPAAASGLLASLCGAATELGFDCSKNAANAWSEIRLPLIVPGGDLLLHKKIVTVPVAFVSLAYFIFMGCWTVFIGWPRPYARKPHRLPLAVAVCGGLVSLFFLSLMVFGQAPWCLPCLAVHAANIVLAALTCRMGAARRGVTDADRGEARRRRVPTREVVSLVAFSMILVAGLWIYRSEQLAFRRQYRKLTPYRNYVLDLQRNADFLTREYLAQPRHEIPLTDEAAGESDARLVVFTDFQCRSCYCNWNRINTLIIDAFEGRLDIALKHYPLCTECNDSAGQNIHPEACAAAYAAEAARQQGGDEAAWRMHDLLFQHQKALNERTYRDLAKRLGLEADRFVSDMDGAAVRRIIADDIALARRLGVRGTPTMFLDGREVPNLCRTPVFWRAMATRYKGGIKSEERLVQNVRRQFAARSQGSRSRGTHADVTGRGDHDAALEGESTRAVLGRHGDRPLRLQEVAQ